MVSMAQNQDKDQQPPPMVPDSPPGMTAPRRPLPPPEEETEAHEALQMKVAMRFLGSAMVFIGFIQVFLSLGTGTEISVFPMIIYFGGLALWAHSSIQIPKVRYTVIAFSLLCALAFIQYGEVLFWHKYVIYWGTIAMVVYFMFQTPKKPSQES